MCRTENKIRSHTGELMNKLCHRTRITMYTYIILGLPPAAAQVVGPNFAPFFRKTETASA